MEKTVYRVKGPIKLTMQSENDTETLCDDEVLDFVDNILEAIEDDAETTENLAEYIDDDSPLKGVVTEINISVIKFESKLCSWTEVICTRLLTKEEEELVKEYLTGQYSDGWGEGFEQRPLISRKVTRTAEGEYNAETDEYDDDCEYEDTEEVFCHFWHYNNKDEEPFELRMMLHI